MSKYTTEVRFICEYEAGLTKSTGYLRTNEIINLAYPKVFDFDFPIYDGAYRPVLCKKILKHYYTREIGEETVGLWKLRLDTRLNEIMPYYNQLYESALLEFDPLRDTDLKREYTKTGEQDKAGNTRDTDTKQIARTSNIGFEKETTDNQLFNSTDTFNDTVTHAGTDSREGNSTQEFNANDVTRNLFSDTPQGSLNRLESEDYLTDARKITDVKDDTTTNEFEESGTNNYSDAHTGTVGTTGNNTQMGTEESTTAQTDNVSENDNRTGMYGETINTTDDYIEHLIGKSSGMTFSKMIMEYRETLLNIDMMIINELQDLFMNIW